MWILEKATIRNDKVYRHEYFEHEDGRIDWRVKTVDVKPLKPHQKPWDLELDLAAERSVHEKNRLDRRARQKAEMESSGQDVQGTSWSLLF